MPAQTLSTSIPSSVQELILLGNRAKKDSTVKAQYKEILPYVHSSLTIGRHLDHAVIVALGKSGHGKSKTINTLIGRDLLSFAKPSDGSTTKAIQRISIQNPDSNTGVNVRLAYDDTPGLFDTKDEDREKINDLLRKYDKDYYPRIPPDGRLTYAAGGNHREKLYPNAILLVTTWDSIRGKYPPSLRETMGNLRESGLIDHEHPNVIVVVTKSLSSWNDYEDFDSDPEKNQKWQEDADEKKQIIDDLRLKVFPSSTPWQVVFIENGGGQSILQDFKRLPNGDLSHQNLFDAIYNLFVGADVKKGDLVGLGALRFLTGDHSVLSGLRLSPVETLLQSGNSILERNEFKVNSEQSKREDAHIRSSTGSVVQHNFAQVAKSHLGVCYDPIRKAFGRVPVVIMNDSDIEIDLHASRQESKIISSDMVEEVESATKFQLGLEFDIPSACGTRLDYSSASGTRAVQSSKQHMFKATKRTAVARLKILTPNLSDDMCKVINGLPPWDDSSSDVKKQYGRFFTNHGTHVNLQAAMGGTLCVVVQGGSVEETDEFLKTLQASADVPAAPQFVTAGANVGYHRAKGKDRTSAQASILINRIGGKIVDTQLSTTLHEVFAYCRSNSSQPSAVHGWVDVRSRWIEALETDSAFCPRDPETRYSWLCDLEGLSSEQKVDLRTASEWYLRGDDTPLTTGSLRQENLKRVEGKIGEHTSWFRKTWHRIWHWKKH